MLMKTIVFKTTLSLFCALAFVIPAIAQFSGGNGSVATPYLISSQQDLAQLADDVNGDTDDYAGKYFSLTGDIVLNSAGPGMSTTEGWTPIGEYTYADQHSFKGHFDGGDFTISGFFSDKTAKNQEGVGLFGYIEDATIHDLNISCSGDIQGRYYTGTVVGYCLNSNIYNCSVQGNSFSVKTNGNQAGGVIGKIESSIAGRTVKIENVSARINVNALYYYAGGIVGVIDLSNGGCMLIKEVFSSGNIGAEEGGGAGGIVGNVRFYNNNSSFSIEYAYSTGNVTSQSSGNVGGIVGNLYFDSGASNNSFSISNVFAAGDITANFDAGGIVGYFRGGDGNNFTLSNAVSTGKIKTFAGNSGGIIGCNEVKNNSTISISNVFATGDVSGEFYIGGIIGGNSSNNGSISITLAYATGNVTGSDNTVGGIIGLNVCNGGTITVSCSYATGNVTGSNNNVGGIVGLNESYDGGISTVSHSLSTGDVTATGGTYFGGIAGFNESGNFSNNSQSIIQYCYGKRASNGELLGGYDDHSGQGICTFDNNDDISVLTDILGFLNSNCADAWSQNGDGTIVLNAMNINIALNAQGGTGAPASISARIGESFKQPANPVKTNYIFKGWFTEPHGGVLFNFNQQKAEWNNTIKTLYAQWSYIEPVRIINQPRGANVCYGSEYALFIYASGTDLQYQWYRNDVLIPGATGAAYYITNAQAQDFGTYYVVVRAPTYEPVRSVSTYVGLAEPLPADLTLASASDGEIVAGVDYNFVANEYSDVTFYEWTSESKTVLFWPKTGLNARVTFTQPGDDIVYVILSHSCGERRISYPVTVLEHSTSTTVVDDRLKVYPNPVSDILTLTGLRHDAVIRLYTLTGTTVATYKVSDYMSETTMTIDLTGLTPGMYFINVNDETLKIIKK